MKMGTTLSARGTPHWSGPPAVLRTALALAATVLAALCMLVALMLAQEGTANAQSDRSGEKRLRALSLSSDADGVIDLSPAFHRDTTNYTASVPFGTSRITVRVTAPSRGSVRHFRTDVDPVTPGHQYDLQVGENKLTVEGVAENDGGKKYLVTVTRSQFYHADATLSALTLSSGLSPSFDPATIHYTSAVRYSTTRVTVTATANDSNATVSYNSVDADAATGHQVDLDKGENIIVVTVTDRDGMTSREYVIRAWRHAINHSGGNTILRSHGSSDQYGLTLTGNIVMTRFTTGPSAGGYAVNAIRLHFSSAPSSPGRWTLDIRKDSDNSVVGTFHVLGLTVPTVQNAAFFYATSPIELDASTTYRLRFRKYSGTWELRARQATSDGADSSSLFGWSMPHKVCADDTCSGVWNNRVLDLRFYGAEVDDTAPVLSGAIFQGNKITMTYDDLLDDGSVPATSAFAVRVRFADVTVNNVAVSGREVVLTLASSAAETDIVVLSYTVPGSNPIRNTGHHAAGARSNLGVGSADPTRLKSLTVGGVMVPGFDRATFSYTVDLPYERRGSIAVTATAQHGDSYTKGRVNGNSSFSGHRSPATGWERLQVGANEVTIRVYSGCCSAEQLAESRTYTLTINRAAPPDRFGPFDDSLPNNHGAEAIPVNTDYCRNQIENDEEVLRCNYLYKHAERANARNVAVEVVVRPRSTDSAIRGYRILRTRYPLNMGSVWRRASYDTPERDAILTDAYVIREVPNSSWANYFDHDVDHGYCYVYAVQTVGGTEASPEYAPALHWVDPASVSNTPRYHSEVPPRCIPHYTGTDAPPDAPGAPQNLAATAGEDGVALTWDASAGADSYRVLRRNQDDALYAEIGTTTTNSYTDATAVVAQGYAYKVQASNDSGDSEFSEHVLAMIVPPAPDAPTGFEAEVGEDSVTLSWDASDDDTITSYTVIRQVRDADPPQIVLLRLDSGETNRVTDSSPEAGAAYTYSVMAINAGGRSEAATVDVDIPESSDAEEVDTPAESPFAGFILVDASDQTVLASLTSGADVELVDPDGGSYGVRAELADGRTVGSVKLELSGAKAVTSTENFAPYSLYGDSYQGDASDLYGQALPAGSYTLTATAYPERTGGGDELGSLAVSFTVTQANRAPEFGSATYSFSIAEDAATGAAVGSVSATDADSDGLTYTIESGNGDGKFSIDGSTGAITTAGALDHETTPSYALTVQADDGNGGTATATVNVTVTGVDESSAGPLTGFTLVDASDQTVLATLSDGGSVELADPGGGSYGIRVDFDSNVSIGSMQLGLSGAKTVTRTENIAPYSLYGDSNQGGASDLYGEALPAGSYTLRVTAYAGSNLGGDVLGVLEISFTIL